MEEMPAGHQKYNKSLLSVVVILTTFKVLRMFSDFYAHHLHLLE